MTRSISLTGDLAFEPEIGEDDYALVLLDPGDLRALASALRQLAPSEQLTVNIGDTCIRLEPISGNDFLVELTHDGVLSIQASRTDLTSLATRLERMADEPMDDVPPHVHLDQHVTRRPRGVSDVVIQLA